MKELTHKGRSWRGPAVDLTTYTISEIKDMFNLETAGDAWALVIDNDWECDNSANGRTWQVTIPPTEIPQVVR